ncbi:MAG: winged helix-turn-helix domain-containing protein, partial [Acidobacteriota bacterium]
MPVPQPARRVYEFGPFRLDPGARLLRKEGQVVPLSAKGFDILLVLVENAGKPVEKEALIRAVWPDTFVEESNLTHHMAVLRKALGEAPAGRAYIETLSKRGYQFVGRVSVGWQESSADRDLAVSPAPQVVAAQPATARRRRLAAAVALVLAGAVFAALASYLILRPGGETSLKNITFAQLTDQPGQELYPSLSPDGNAFVYASRAGGNWD